MKGLLRLAGLSFTLVGLLALTAKTANRPVERRVVSPHVDRAMMYSFPEEPRTLAPTKPSAAELPSLGAPASGFYNESAGIVIGATWHDKQHNGTMGRMVDWGTDPVHGLIVHFNWMKLELSTFQSRHYRYNAWVTLIDTFAFDGGMPVQPPEQYAGYVGIDVTPDNRAVVGGHVNEGDGDYGSHIYFDACPACGSFSSRQARVPFALGLCASVIGSTETIWPKFRYQFGTDTILHVFAVGSEDGAGTPQAIAYFRRRAPETALPGTGWLECLVVDTVFDISQDIGASKTSDRIVLAWTANLPAPGDCVWCSDNEGGSQINNDLYYMVSNDQGAHFDQRVNLTMADSTVDGFRAYTDLSVLMDSEDIVHVAWSGRYWPADPNAQIYWNCKLFHWSELIGFELMEDGSPGGPNITSGNARTVYDANWTIGTGPGQSQCTGGSWAMNVDKMSVSECDGKFYVLWSQFNDPINGVIDDCAGRWNGGSGDISGAANGELWISVSNNGGVNWDQSRNLTNSYSSGCDPEGAAGPCESDAWPSMARFGTNEPGLFPEDAIVDPSVNGIDSPYVGGYYLDVMYINDFDAGGITNTEGTWQNSPVKWFRMACVEPIPDPRFGPSWTQIDYPAYAQHGQQLDTALTITNNGNVSYDYVIIVEEDSGPSGWLSHTGFSGSTPSGLEPTETGMVHLNSGGIVNEPGTVVELLGRLIFSSNASSSPDTLPIRLIVAPTVVAPAFDTVSTSCLSLVVETAGNFGRQGSPSQGKVNMDYVDAGDCDSDASVYLYDGSPVVGWIDDGDTVMNWSMFGDGWWGPNGFRPVSHTPTTDMGEYEMFSATFVTSDTSLQLEQTFYAPTNPDSCNFIIQRLQLTSGDAQDHTGLVIGQAIDWDIPSDSGMDNGSGFDFARNLIYQFGGEYNDTVGECQDNDLRYGGLAFIESRVGNECLAGEEPYGAYTASAGERIYPNGHFVPSDLFSSMKQVGGYEVYENQDSALIDLHTVMTYDTDLFIGADSVVTYYTVLATTMDGGLAGLEQAIDAGKQWYLDHLKPAEPDDSLCSCCQVLCDSDNSGSVDVADVSFYVDYLFRGGLPPVCDIDAGQCDMLESTTVADLTYIVDYLFNGGPPPAACGEI